MYAFANAALELKHAVLEDFATQNRENLMVVNEVKETPEKIDTLQEAVALLVKTVVGCKVLTPKKRGRRNL